MKNTATSNVNVSGLGKNGLVTAGLAHRLDKMTPKNVTAVFASAYTVSIYIDREPDWTQRADVTIQTHPLEDGSYDFEIRSEREDLTLWAQGLLMAFEV